MNFRNICVSFVCILIIILFISCSQQKTEWKGTIEEVDGVTVVKNPKEPMYDENVFVLEEELSIGEVEGKEEYIFSRIRDVDVDGKGNIYVLDSGEAHIKVFNKNGEYVRTIGKKGQGPGEMQLPGSISLTPGNEVIINDGGARHLHFFNLSGDYLKSISQTNMSMFIRPKVDSQNNIIASYIIMDNVVTSVLKKFDSELNEIFTISSYKLAKYPIINPFFPQLYWEITGEDNIIWGCADKYEIQILNPKGQLILKIIKDYDPIDITDEEKEKWIKDNWGEQGVSSDVKVTWNEHHNPFIYLSIDDSGRVYLRTYEKVISGEGYYYDVFDSKGKYIVKVPIKVQPQVWRKNKLYAIEEDEDGYQYVKRYQVTWKI